MIQFQSLNSSPAAPVLASPPSREELERLGEEIAALAVHLDTSVYRLLVRLRDFDQRDGWNSGFLSCAHWLSWRTGIDPGAAREKVRVARALGELPVLGGAMERGELSYSKVRALTRIANPENEAELLELARHATAAQVETIVRAWRRVDRQAEANAERERHERRQLLVYVDDDGSYVVRGRLDPEVGALLERALDEAARALYPEPPTVSAADIGPSGLASPTATQRRADALGLLVELALGARETAMGSAATDRCVSAASAESSLEARPSRSLGRRAPGVQVVLHVDAEALRQDSESGQSVLAGGVRVSAETSRRLACDASRVIMTRDGGGRVLDVGRRTRTVPTAIRTALEHRDRGCCFPGCTNRITDAHHVRHWADGGPTRLENLMLLCRRHHRALHEGGFRVNVTAAGAFVFTRPDGRVLSAAPPPPVRSLHRLTVDPDPPARVPFAPYERLDLDWTMRTIVAGGWITTRE